MAARGRIKTAVAGLLAACVAQATSAAIYVCIDGKGRRLTSDRPIPECMDRDQRQLNPSGSLLRVVPPAPTEHERLEADERRRRQMMARSRAIDDQRRERVLLTRYPDQQAHDNERANALQRSREVEEFARQRILQLEQQRKDLEASLPSYAGKVPAGVRQDLADNVQALDAQKRAISQQADERMRIDQRFDAELAHLRILWVQGIPPLQEPPP